MSSHYIMQCKIKKKYVGEVGKNLSNIFNSI